MIENENENEGLREKKLRSNLNCAFDAYVRTRQRLNPVDITHENNPIADAGCSLHWHSINPDQQAHTRTLFYDDDVEIYIVWNERLLYYRDVLFRHYFLIPLRTNMNIGRV